MLLVEEVLAAVARLGRLATGGSEAVVVAALRFGGCTGVVETSHGQVVSGSVLPVISGLVSFVGI